jgi:cation diffusion facilitator family transporter
MPAPEASHERRSLWVSVGATAGLGGLGVLWGIASGSQMILLDGAYGLIGVLVSALLIRASTVSAAPPSVRYPYGRGAATPLAIGVQGFVLLGTLLYAGLEAVWVLRAGGSDVGARSGVVYGVIATVGAAVVWRWLAGRAAGSDLLTAEALAWKVSALGGVGMVVGFTVLGVLERSDRWSDAAPYVDPVMVLVTCLAFLPDPVRMVRRTLVELLEGAPDDDVVRAVRQAVDRVQDRFDLAAPVVRTTKVGPKLYVEVEGVVEPTVTVSQEHEVRTALEEGLAHLPYDVWLNLELLPRATPPG